MAASAEQTRDDGRDERNCCQPSAKADDSVSIHPHLIPLRPNEAGNAEKMATGSPQPVAFLARSPKLTQRANCGEVPVAFWLLIRSALKIPSLYGTVRRVRCLSSMARTASRMPRAR